MGISEAVARAAVEDLIDIIEEGKYLLRAGRIMEAVRTILEYFNNRLSGEYAQVGPPLDEDKTVKVLAELKDKLEYAKYGDNESGIDPLTVIAIINIAVEIIKIIRNLRS